ncbi:hypothetical protein GIS00_20970 [Nakamurella sp. YIM 132087]|uniref:Uncharacterized protein n=1 Tax=Nakamurella alba TaxID=2665158 RepID=A0A7K1FQI3_9ACTN|nr:hypothetical protein [Nakamurella alba]MTD16412.1 hypothetical protein [Nakamurella alba]
MRERAGRWRCRLGLHRMLDLPDPNPESGGLEKQGYSACADCTKVRDRKVYLPSAGIGGPLDRL